MNLTRTLGVVHLLSIRPPFGSACPAVYRIHPSIKLFSVPSTYVCGELLEFLDLACTLVLAAVDKYDLVPCYLILHHILFLSVSAHLQTM